MISSSSRSGGRPDAASALTTTCTRPGLRNCAGERLTAILRSPGHFAAVAQACRIAHSPSGTMKPISSASGMNVAGRDQALLGMAPADQRLEAADLVAREIDDRLVVQLELAGRQRLAQVVLHGAARLHLRVHLRLEEAEGAAPVALGAIERQIGVADQLVGAQPVGRADGDADAGADHHLVAVDLVGLAHRLDDALRQRGGIGRLGDGDLHDGELVAAHARDGVGLAHQRAQAVGHHLAAACRRRDGRACR